ncbi:MAG: phosphotransferase, partial [Caldilineaceae bacterium]|nr:phosphotransferase [Caldilineaceae bacterium]
DAVMHIAPLLSYLDQTRPTQPLTWQPWQLTPIPGGANNLLYRATHTQHPPLEWALFENASSSPVVDEKIYRFQANRTIDLAIKFTVRDERNRAQREHDALVALRQGGQAIAPEPLFVDTRSYRQPVVVQRWLFGHTLSGPPTSTAQWQQLVDHYCAIHTVTPANTQIQLAPAVINATSGATGKALIERDLARIPPEARRESLNRLVAWAKTWEPPMWKLPQLTLCRVDGNWRNFIQQEEQIASVDWENSGWGDPAFEIADVITHPAYVDVPEERWAWMIEAYAAQQADATVMIRIQTYVTVMRLWWVVRSACYLYEVPRGLDERLVSRPADWEERAEQLFARAVALAEQAIAQ